MASLINAVFVLLTMLFLASLFENLPAATLGAVVIDAMLGVVTFGPMRRYFRVNRADWVFFMGAMLGILFFGIIQGILIGVVLSLLLLIARASKPGDPPAGPGPEARRLRRPGPVPRSSRRSRVCSCSGWTAPCSSPTPTGSATRSTR